MAALPATNTSLLALGHVLKLKNGQAFQIEGEEQSKAETQKYDTCIGKN